MKKNRKPYRMKSISSVHQILLIDKKVHGQQYFWGFQIYFVSLHLHSDKHLKIRYKKS